MQPKGRRFRLALFIVLGAVVTAVLVAVAILREPLDRQRSLTSLKKVDDYPLYTMRYYGDYHFDDWLKQGLARRGVQSLDSGDEAWACTCFAGLARSGDLVYGRNFDWYTEPAILLFTDPPQGYASVSLVHGRQALARPLDAPYQPYDGMNERGLVVGMMAVPASAVPFDPARVSIGSLHAIRLLLDRAATVDEAVALLGQYNIVFTGGPPLHYLVADATGHAATVEFLEGQMRVLHNAQPWQVATNFLLAAENPEGAHSSCSRYNEAYATLAQANGHLAEQESMALLQRVSQDITVWSVTYNLTRGDVRVAMGRQYDQVHVFRLAQTR